MNYSINIPPIGGMSTQIYTALAIILENNLNLDEIDTFKLNCIADWYDNDIFDNIYQYDNSLEFIPINPTEISNINRDLYCSLKDLSFNRERLHYLINLNKFRPEIEVKINDYINKYKIDINTLGIHIRLTDMDTMHPNHGVKTYKDYYEIIKTFLSDNKDIKKIFLASDNYESIRKIKIDFPEIKINHTINVYRNRRENSDNYKEQMLRSKNKNYIIDSFIDMYLLSKCGYLIHRISGFSYCSILYSSTITKNYCI